MEIIQEEDQEKQINLVLAIMHAYQQWGIAVDSSSQILDAGVTNPDEIQNSEQDLQLPLLTKQF